MSIFREHLLRGKTAFVTGGGSGIGQRMAERFAQHGAKVMLVGRRQETPDAAAGTNRAPGGLPATHGVDVLIKTLAIEWGPAGVRCNCITPGPTDDTEGMRRLAPTEEARKKTASGVPLRRFGTKDELADLALFLCSDAASYITGGIYLCYGGMSLARSTNWLQGVA